MAESANTPPATRVDLDSMAYRLAMAVTLLDCLVNPSEWTDVERDKAAAREFLAGENARGAASERLASPLGDAPSSGGRGVIDSTAPGDGPALLAALQRHGQRQRREAADAIAQTETMATDGRFTMGLVVEVAKAIEAHGYGRCEGRQYVDLQQHLFHFLHGGNERCTGGAR